jgi:GNAT superfamily N-acetyltransferase
MSQIRRAASADAGQVFTLTRDFATSFSPEFGAFMTSFDQLIVQSDALVLVADDTGEVLGYLLGFDHYALFANGRVSWAEEIMVREDRRQQHVGADLMKSFEQWAESRGSKLVALATRRAAGFYSSLGYEESAAYFRKVLSRD